MMDDLHMRHSEPSMCTAHLDLVFDHFSWGVFPTGHYLERGNKLANHTPTRVSPPTMHTAGELQSSTGSGPKA